jgi:hypothetical protein
LQPLGDPLVERRDREDLAIAVNERFHFHGPIVGRGPVPGA